MDQSNKSKIPSELSLAVFLSGVLTIVLTITYSILCILALVYRNQCSTGLATDATGSTYFIDTVYRVYIQQTSCDNPESSGPQGVELMSPETVFIFVLFILILSVFSCAAAIVLIIVVTVENKARYIYAAVWVHICICVSALVIDITLAILFGLDHGKLDDVLSNSTPGIVINYRNDALRLGSLLLMAVSMKGYLAHVFNVVFLILLAIYATRYKSKLLTDEHSIHKMGALNAYESKTAAPILMNKMSNDRLQNREDAWQQQQELDVPVTRSQINRGFVPDEEPRRSPRSPARPMPLPPLSDYSNGREYDRSESWQHAGSRGSRPFSYMEEPRRSPARPTPSPGAEPQWRRDPWPQAPPVPAPDYSPPSRRLKSALKPNYM